MTFLEFGKKILDRIPDAQYQKLNKLCDLIKFNYACRIKDEADLETQLVKIITPTFDFSKGIALDGVVKGVMKTCKEYYVK